MPRFNEWQYYLVALGKHGEEKRKKERRGGTGRPRGSFSWGQFNSLWKWSWPSLGSVFHLAGFLGGGVWTETTCRGMKFSTHIPKMDVRGLGWNPQRNIPDSSYKGLSRSWGDDSDQTVTMRHVLKLSGTKRVPMRLSIQHPWDKRKVNRKSREIWIKV